MRVQIDNTMAVGAHASQETGARWIAHGRLAISAFEQYALRGQFIDIRTDYGWRPVAAKLAYLRQLAQEALIASFSAGGIEGAVAGKLGR